MTIRVAVIGARGMVGRSWAELLSAHGVAHATFTREQIDLANPATLSRDNLLRVLPSGVEWVVNCGAYTQVDQAETDYAAAAQVNGDAVGSLALAAKELGARLVHYSTDYVFAGNASTPYPLDAPIAPCNAYGKTKALGEQRLRESGVGGLLLRTSWVYAPWGVNFVRTMQRLLSEKPELKVVNDQRGRPTSAQALAENSWRWCQYIADKPGLHVGHLTDGGECTWFEFATEIGRQLQLKGRTIPCTTDEFPRPAKRPAYSVFDIAETERVLGPLPDWRVNLAAMLKIGASTG